MWFRLIQKERENSNTLYAELLLISCGQEGYTLQDNSIHWNKCLRNSQLPKSQNIQPTKKYLPAGAICLK